MHKVVLPPFHLVFCWNAEIIRQKLCGHRGRHESDYEPCPVFDFPRAAQSGTVGALLSFGAVRRRSSAESTSSEENTVAVFGRAFWRLAYEEPIPHRFFYFSIR